MAGELIGLRIVVRKFQDWVGEFINVVVSLDVDVRLFVGGATEVIKPDAMPERPGEKNSRHDPRDVRADQNPHQ